MRYSQFLTQTALKHQTVSYNLLTPKPVEGDPTALMPKKISVTQCSDWSECFIIMRESV